LLATARLSVIQILRGAARCFLAAATSSYIAVMVLLMSCVTCARPLISRGKQFGYVGLGLGAALGSTVLGLVMLGLLRAGGISQFSGVGYGYFSMNLLALIDPQVTGSFVLKQQAIGPGQYEAYNYLGFGVLILGLAALARAPSSLRALLRGTAVPLLIVVGVSLLLALSTKAMFGTCVLYDFLAPKFVMQVHAKASRFWPMASGSRIEVPQRMIGSDGVVRLELHSADAVSPAALGLSGDTREISIGLRQLHVQGAEN
jgi:hypothetical protein